MKSAIREQFFAALTGEVIRRPVFAVYDWFVEHRPQVDWKGLLERGLGVIGHATLVAVERPHLRITENVSVTPQGVRRDVTWETDRGSLHEWYLGEWRQAHLIKTRADYRLMARAWEEARLKPDFQAFARTKAEVGGRGMALGSPALGRTAFQAIQIDYAGLERFSVDIADEASELMSLIEQLNEITFRGFELLRNSPARDLKLWENLSLETMGPRLYRQHLVPVYRRILDILRPTGKRLCLHYDGKLRGIARDIAELPFDGVDSLTGPPEGDMNVAEARRAWPDKFLWLHPNLGWYERPQAELRERISRMVREAGPRRFCLMISEEVPTDWERTVPAVLEIIRSMNA